MINEGYNLDFPAQHGTLRKHLVPKTKQTGPTLQRERKKGRGKSRAKRGLLSIQNETPTVKILRQIASTEGKREET